MDEKELEKPKKIRPTGETIARRVRFGLILVLILVLAMAVGFLYYRNKYVKTQRTTKDASIYTWEGDYIDANNYQTTMSIEKKGRGGLYEVSIIMGEDNSSDLIFWKFDAAYDEQNNTLSYMNATREDWVFVEPDKEADSSGTSESSEGEAANTTDDGVMSIDDDSGDLNVQEVYNDGTGHLTVSGGKVEWTDNKENFGNGLVFEKVE